MLVCYQRAGTAVGVPKIYGTLLEQVNTVASTLYSDAVNRADNGPACYGVDTMDPTAAGAITVRLRVQVTSTAGFDWIQINAVGLKLKTSVSAVSDFVNPRSVPFQLGPGVPNPLRSATTIPIETASDGSLALNIFDAQGRIVRSLWNGFMPAGRHEFRWDGSDDFRRDVPGGVYFYQLEVGGVKQSRKAVVLR